LTTTHAHLEHASEVHVHPALACYRDRLDRFEHPAYPRGLDVHGGGLRLDEPDVLSGRDRGIDARPGPKRHGGDGRRRERVLEQRFGESLREALVVSLRAESLEVEDRYSARVRDPVELFVLPCGVHVELELAGRARTALVAHPRCRVARGVERHDVAERRRGDAEQIVEPGAVLRERERQRCGFHRGAVVGLGKGIVEPFREPTQGP
jgi:hypothetical protein